MLVTFNSISSYITYKVTITNIGNAEMGIFQINGLPEGVSYEITDYDLKDKISSELILLCKIILILFLKFILGLFFGILVDIIYKNKIKLESGYFPDFV